MIKQSLIAVVASTLLSACSDDVHSANYPNQQPYASAQVNSQGYPPAGTFRQPGAMSGSYGGST